ncbi:hypothetical protein MmmBen181_0661 [Mycoplasma mycoides subsp. mycoides]|nr:hypothetical protein MmmBen181_0661 [Mycoplasma mycoides subsp. mycoides]
MKLNDKLKNFFNNIKSYFTTKEKIIVKNKPKPIETKTENNNNNLDNNSQFYHDISNNKEYIDKRATLDSQNEFILKVISNKAELLEQLVDIKNTFKHCEDCLNIYKKKSWWYEIKDFKIKKIILIIIMVF